MKETKFKAVIDRVEGNKIVILVGDDEQDAIDLPRSLLPDAKDGDILNIKIAIKSRKTDEAKKEVADMISKLAARKNL